MLPIMATQYRTLLNWHCFASSHSFDNTVYISRHIHNKSNLESCETQLFSISPGWRIFAKAIQMKTQLEAFYSNAISVVNLTTNLSNSLRLFVYLEFKITYIDMQVLPKINAVSISAPTLRYITPNTIGNHRQNPTSSEELTNVVRRFPRTSMTFAESAERRS